MGFLNLIFFHVPTLLVNSLRGLACLRSHGGVYQKGGVSAVCGCLQIWITKGVLVQFWHHSVGVSVINELQLSGSFPTEVLRLHPKVWA